MKTKLSIVTFNLRMDNRHDGANYFFDRAPFILETIDKEKPDVIGFQEATPKILAWLTEQLSDYTVVGCGRGRDLSDEANPIAFRKDRFDLFRLDQFWLSPTPLVAGSRYEDQSDCPRICLTAYLRIKTSGRLLRIYNTHLDHISESARKLGMDSILARIAEDDRSTDAPKLLMGDMNARPNEACIRAALSSGLYDFTREVKHSFHDFGREMNDKKIDYIFGGGCQCRSTRVWTMTKGALYLSDHYPIGCEVIAE